MEKKSKVSWGVIVAGAAIVAGVVLFAPVLSDKIPEMAGQLLDKAKDLGAWIVSLFTPAAPAASEAASQSVSLMAKLTGDTAMKVYGAGLIGGGTAYLMSRPSAEDEGHENHHHAMQKSFALREDIRKMQARQMLMAAAAGHPQAHAMMMGGR